MTRSVRWVLISFALFAGGVILALPAYIAWERWRENALLAFCKDVSVGMSFADLLRTERRHWIDNSYLVEALFKDYVDQACPYCLTYFSYCLPHQDSYHLSVVQSDAAGGRSDGCLTAMITLELCGRSWGGPASHRSAAVPPHAARS
jgi:hypothetical protein